MNLVPDVWPDHRNIIAIRNIQEKNLPIVLTTQAEQNMAKLIVSSKTWHKFQVKKKSDIKTLFNLNN